MGNVVSLPLAGLLCQYGFSEGWDSVFYVIGENLLLFHYVADYGNPAATEMRKWWTYIIGLFSLVQIAVQCHHKRRTFMSSAAISQGSHSPGKLLEFYARPGIFGMLSQFTLVLTLTAVSHTS